MRSSLSRLALLPLLVFTATCGDTTATQAFVDFLLNFCSAPFPSFVAIKNDDGSWTQVTLDVNGKATVQVGQKFGIATVTPNLSGGYYTQVAYLARSEGAAGGPVCDVTGTKTVNGSISTLSAGTEAQVQLGNRSTFLFAGGSSSFSITQVRSGGQDLVAQRRTSSTGIADKFIVRRAQDIANTASMTLLDFAGVEAVTPASGAVTITGLTAPESKSIYSLLRTSNTGNAYFFFNSPAATTTSGTVYGLPSAQVLSTDMHVVSVYGSSTGAEHGVDIFKRNIGATNADVGPALSTPTVTAVTTSPKVLRVQLASQSEYGKLVEFYYEQGSSTTYRAMDITTTAGYLGSTPTTWDIQPPADLFAVSGFPAAAAFGSGVITYWDVYAQGDVADWFKQTIDVPDGTVSKWADKYTTGTTGLIMAPESVQSSVTQGFGAHRAMLRRGGFKISQH